MPPLDVPTAIAKRRSIKSFQSTPIAPEVLQQLVELTVAAPSSFNLQDWRIILVQDEAQKAALAAASWGQQQIVQAPVTFVFAADLNSWQDQSFMSMIYEQGVATGAWTPQFLDYLKTAMPQFQANLGEKAREYAVKDATIAATHLMLAAESLGLSSCPMNGWIEEQVKAVIGATDQPNIAIAMLVPIGYAAEPRQFSGRVPLEMNVFVDRLGNAYPA